MPGAEQPVNLPYGVQRAASGSVGVLLRLQSGLENRLQDQYCRHLHHTILDRWDAQRSLLAVRLWDVHPPDRLGTIRLRPEFFRQFVAPSALAVRLDVLEPLAIDTP